MRKSVKIITGFLLTAILSAAAVFASFSDRLDVVNHISVGDVSISISEYARKGKGEVKYTQPSEVVPGQTISKIPRIKNNALPCWIRARITYAGENGKLERLKDENIGGISGEWVKRGEYYYYTKVLKKQESTDLFQNISIPDTWTEEHAKQKIAVDIQADAIQAANFKPDFSAMSPWGNQVIQKCVHEQDGTLTCKKGNTKLSVEFNGKAHKLIAVPDDFFTNLESAMPGDILKDAVQIANTTDQEAELFFQTNTDGRSEEQMNMLKKVRFEISQNKKILYKGTLDAAELAKARSLGKFKSGQKGSLCADPLGRRKRVSRSPRYHSELFRADRTHNEPRRNRHMPYGGNGKRHKRPRRGLCRPCRKARASPQKINIIKSSGASAPGLFCSQKGYTASC